MPDLPHEPVNEIPGLPDGGLTPLASAKRVRHRWDAGPRIRCRLTTVHPERHLARAVCNYLAEEMPDIEFTLREDVEIDAIWICGYEPGHVGLVQKARHEDPEALIVVTGRAPRESWRDEVLAAGADHASGWPIPYSELSRLFHDKGSQAIA